MIPDHQRRRLASCAERVRTLNAEVDAERARRNRIVRELIDAGETYRAVARAAGLSLGQVAAILTTTD